MLDRIKIHLVVDILRLYKAPLSQIRCMANRCNTQSVKVYRMFTEVTTKITKFSPRIEEIKLLKVGKSIIILLELMSNWFHLSSEAM